MRPILFAQEYTLHMFQILAKLTRSFIEGAYLAHSSPNRFLRELTGVYCIHSFDTNSLRPHKFITRGSD